jgi:site-specific recombinase XerC
MYRGIYARYIKDDPFCQLKMREVEQTHCLAFMSRLRGMKGKDKNRGGGAIAGTRTYEIVIKFIRMAFTEYGETHETWRNPFGRIKPPKSKTARERDILEAWEIRRLFEPGIIPDPLDRTLAAAMFWAGLRRGDPKWHKVREIPFPVQLQEAIRELWAACGRHEFVFCDRKRQTAGHKAYRAASALLDRGVPLPYIQDLLEHSDLKMTRHYLHETADHINKMGGKISEAMKVGHEEGKILDFKAS